MADSIFELQVDGVSGVSGNFFFPSGAQLLSGDAGDVTTDFKDFSGVAGYQEITLSQDTNFNGVVDELYPLFSGTDLGAFAVGIFNDLMLVSGSAFSVSYISGWLMNHIGELNTQAQTYFNTASGFCIPAMNFQEIAIYQEMFTSYYYKRNAANLLGASAYDWTRLSEADSTVVKVSRNELAKTYRQLALDADSRLKMLVSQYRMTNATPKMVTGDDAVPAPFSDRYNFYYPYNYFPYYGLYFTRAFNL